MIAWTGLGRERGAGLPPECATANVPTTGDPQMWPTMIHCWGAAGDGGRGIEFYTCTTVGGYIGRGMAAWQPRAHGRTEHAC